MTSGTRGMTAEKLRFWSATFCAPAFCALALCATGCKQVSYDNLRTGYDALGSRNYDRALQLADAEIRKDPNAIGIAEAYYLRGAALENKPATNVTESVQNRAAARLAYEQALAHNPSRQLMGYTRASLGNVAFFQDDYARAAEMSKLAYGDLDRPNEKAIVLLRAGQSLQRLGRFEEADAIFDQLIRSHAGTPQAAAAAGDRGARAFYLQLAAFREAPRASRAEDDLRRQGFRGISSARNAQGLYLVRLGPYRTYNEAKFAREQLRAKFPDAIIQP